MPDYRISIGDEEPRDPNRFGRGNEKAENAYARNLLNQLVINGRWGKVEGYETEDGAKNGARAVYKVSAKHGRQEGWRAETRIQDESDGTFSLFVRMISLT